MRRTSQNTNAAACRKNRCFCGHFREHRNPPKTCQYFRFFVSKIRNTLSRSVAFLYILHQVRRLAIKHFANFVKSIYRKMLDGIITDCRYCGRTDAGLFRQILLCHFSDCKHYFYFEFVFKSSFAFFSPIPSIFVSESSSPRLVCFL